MARAQAKKLSRKARRNISIGHLRAAEFDLMPYPEIAAAWERKSGERISKSRVFQICQVAEQKLRRALQDLDRSE